MPLIARAVEQHQRRTVREIQRGTKQICLQEDDLQRRSLQFHIAQEKVERDIQKLQIMKPVKRR